LKEFWHVGRKLDDGDPFRRWMPDNIDVPDLKSFKEKTNKLFLQFDALGNQILEGIALDLGINSNFFHKVTNKGNSVMRVIHYPPVGIEESGERAGPHEDINLITLLIGGQQAGLEILSKNNEWLRVSVDSDVIVCNIGDMLQRLTNNNMISTTHRVNALEEECNSSRYSIPFFVHPNPDWFIETLENQITDSNPNHYPDGILSEDFLQERLKEIKLI
jgi:isopenicillin N synthase-like dioxygenase